MGPLGPLHPQPLPQAHCMTTPPRHGPLPPRPQSSIPPPRLCVKIPPLKFQISSFKSPLSRPAPLPTQPVNPVNKVNKVPGHCLPVPRERTVKTAFFSSIWFDLVRFRSLFTLPSPREQIGSFLRGRRCKVSQKAFAAF
jgi:hypothetical protein